MPFIKRNEQGEVSAVSETQAPDYMEELSRDDPAIAAFIARVGSTKASSLDASDQDFVRVLEDVVELLVAKGVILFTELPTNAQEKIMRRQKMRSQVGNLEDLIGDD